MRVLVAMVSRDPVVLAKLVNTLQPDALLLFQTRHAERQGWARSPTDFWASRLHLVGPELVDGDSAAAFASSAQRGWARLAAQMSHQLQELWVDHHGAGFAALSAGGDAA